MPKRHKPVDVDYVVFSRFYEDVRAEMMTSNYCAMPKDADVSKLAEQIGLTAQECAALIIRNRNKPQRVKAKHQRHMKAVL